MAVYAWGRASDGQLGLGGIEEGVLSTPTLVGKFPITAGQLKDIVCGWEHSAFLTDDGILYTCGKNDFGQLGHDKGQTRPERVDSLEVHFLKQVALGSAHTLALTDRGVMFAWGSNEKGQLGLSSLDDKHLSKPRMVKVFSSVRVVQMACGADHSLAMTDGGYLFSWGGNQHGQLGIGKVDAGYPVPQFISSLKGIPFCLVCAGGYHSFALSFSGALFGWGKNSFGQLGVGDNKDRCMPTLVKSLRSQRVRHVVCGENHTVVLTEDGGVFAFGGGSYGQLGHNSFNHEYNPRKVAELMGSTVTQITCGRFHTFAFVPSSGKLYAFGLGASGQLGIAKLNNFNSPIRVIQSWTPASADSAQRPPGLRLSASGGHHSFVLLTNSEENQAPVDMRIIDSSKCLFTLLETGVRDMVRAVSVTSSFAEVSRNLETAFGSQSCLNGSFLDKKTHEKTNSRTHGIELSAVRRCFNLLGGIPRESVLNAVCSSVRDRLIPSMGDWNPPDIEALRFLIMLPECEILHKPDFRLSIDIPFGEAIIRLSPEARKVLRRWWATLPSTYFSQVMKVFQDCVTYFLKLPIPKDHEDVIFQRQAALFTSLSVLEQLHTVNTEAGDIVPFQKFYIPEIQEMVDIRADLYNWLQDESTFSFCRFPFVFDARAKTQLLQTDAIMQMQSAVEEVNRRNLTSIYYGHFDPVNPLLVIVVRRDNIVQDTLTQIMKQGPCNLKKPLKVVFSGEEGIDAGGVAKEFFLLLLTEVLDPKYGMFIFIEESQTIWFNDKTFEENPMFLLIGVICGLAIYNNTIIDLHFPPLLYKKLLDRKPTLDDYRAFQPSIARNLQYLLDYPDDDLDSVFGLNFQIARENYGSLEYIDLLPRGGDTPVTVDNRQQYVDLYLDYYLNKSVSKQFEAFAQGFHRVCGGRVLKFFHPEELMQMVVGCQDYDFRDLEKVAEYKGEYFRGHPVITHFWDVFHEFPQQLKKKFLAFLTGNDRIPILGMKSMKIIIQPVAGGETGDHLPVAHTCFNLLDLPRYPTKDMMKTKLSQAVQYSTGFGLA